jgi:hypothetical protein
MGTNFFYLVTLTLVFDLLIKNFNLDYNIWMVLSDIKNALDNMNPINQHSVYMHLFGL